MHCILHIICKQSTKSFLLLFGILVGNKRNGFILLSLHVACKVCCYTFHQQITQRITNGAKVQVPSKIKPRTGHPLLLLWRHIILQIYMYLGNCTHHFSTLPLIFVSDSVKWLVNLWCNFLSHGNFKTLLFFLLHQTAIFKLKKSTMWRSFWYIGDRLVW